ncbi:hypothetical protein [Pseudomonas nitroreducens]|uniref:hypothetical protein n=1 Tax=Pseudomonas nitroreducens TaxID=46680 RepID=UPI002D80978E|nr:hypothetical protein [Pseudomonas nitroreducens]
MPLPDFRTVTQSELREFWTKYRDPDIRRLILEVQRGRNRMAEVEDMYKGIQKRWREEHGGHWVLLWRFKLLVQEERDRRL